MDTAEAHKLRQERQTRKEAHKVMEAVSAFVNRHGHQGAAILGDELTRDHRTLVQMHMSTVCAFLGALDMQFVTGHYDARNEAACRVANKMWQAVKPHETCMPLI